MKTREQQKKQERKVNRTAIIVLASIFAFIGFLFFIIYSLDKEIVELTCSYEVEKAVEEATDEEVISENVKMLKYRGYNTETYAEEFGPLDSSWWTIDHIVIIQYEVTTESETYYVVGEGREYYSQPDKYSCVRVEIK